MKNFANTLPKALLFILVATIPVQLGKHFWPDFSQVLGIRIDFLSPTIYFTDILIFGFVACCVFRTIVFKKPPAANLVFLLVVFLLSLLLASFTSFNNLLSFFFLVKFLEFAALALAISTLNFETLVLRINIYFAAGALFSAILAIFQFLQQKSLGLWILGERNFDVLTPGIARINLEGNLFLRPYATFAHPNVLAGYLAISAIVVFFAKKQNLPNFFKVLILAVLLTGLFLTFSRSAFLALVFVGIFVIVKNFKFEKSSLKITAAAVFIILVLFFIFPQNLITERFSQLTTTDRHSLILRTKLANVAFGMFSQNLPTGVGLGNFLPTLPNFWELKEDIRFLQPVHNLFLLQAAETGVVGISAFLFLLFKTFKQLFKFHNTKQNFLIPLWIVIVVISLFDHYFWTLQQGQILFWTVLGLTWAKNGKFN